MKPFAIASTAILLASSALAETAVITYTTDESFDDVTFGLESAIVDEGLVIDSVSHVGEMLERTRNDIGSDVKIFSKADVYSFCSATVSRRVMEADPMNLVFCPYGIFVLQLAGDQKVTVGYRVFPQGPMQEVQALLDSIAKAAIGLE